MNRVPMGHLRRIIGFAAVPATTMISTLLLLPILSSRFGPEGWSAVLLGQSVGAFISVIAGLGWQIVGGNLVAGAANHRARTLIYAESLKSRLVILCLVLPIGAAVTYILLPSHGFESILFMVGTSLNCLNASWYFSGTAQPGMIIRNEGLVRLCGYLLSISAVLVLNLLWIYGAILIFVGLYMAFANVRSILGRSGKSVWVDSGATWTIVRGQLSGMFSRLFQAGQLYAGTPFVAYLSPSTLALYSAIDTVQKSVGNATAFYPQAFAWWVGSGSGTAKKNRVRRLAYLTLILGVVGFSAWIFVGRHLMNLLFSGLIVVSAELNLVNGACIATFFVTRSLGLLGMVPLGLHEKYYLMHSISSICSLALFVFGVIFFDITVGLGAVALVGMVMSSLVLWFVLSGSRTNSVDSKQSAMI